MRIEDAILAAPTNHAVMFLVTSYIEALSHGRRAAGIPEFIVRLPLTGESDLYERLAALRRRDFDSRDALPPVVEVSRVFASALDRLQHADGNRAS